MTLAIGQEAEGGEAATAASSEASHAFKFTAVATLTVDTLHVSFAAGSTASSCNIALAADEGGKPKEGLLAEGVIASTAAGAHSVGVTGVAVTSGTVYWLILQPQGGAIKYKPGSTTVRRLDSTTHKKISEDLLAEWGVEANKGPISIWATGSTSGSFTRESADPVSVAETVARILSAPRAGADSLTLAESTAAQKGVSRSTSDTLTVSEATSRVAGFRVASQEVGVFDEATTTVSHFPRSTADTLTVADAAVAVRGVGRQAADPVSLAESTTRLAHTGRTGSDTLAVAESQSVTTETHAKQLTVSLVLAVPAATLSAVEI